MARDPYVIEMDRMLAFADAVTAIAITLLALEIHVPEGLPHAELDQALVHALPKLWAYLLSFVLVGAMWLGHHKLFRLMAGLDRTLVRLEFALLAVIAVLPFTAQLISTYGGTTEGVAVYTGTLGLAPALMTVMALRLRASRRLWKPGVKRREVVREVFENATFVVMAFTCTLIALAAPAAAGFGCLVLLPLRALPRHWPWLRARV